jgi:serine/threonine-protein kinase
MSGQQWSNSQYGQFLLHVEDKALTPANKVVSPQLPQPKRGMSVGKWTLERELGRGGNGQVWLAAGPNGKKAALKILIKLKDSSLARFKDEITALNLAAGVPGVLPILDSHLPKRVGTDRPWYAMSVAVPLLDATKNASTTEKVERIAEVAETMSILHKKGIAHRDIKPGNLLLYEQRCHIGDFGLVDYPNKGDVTAPREQLGARWTMAPEVLREGSQADALPADVFSLGKTMWIILTGIEKGFDGQYDPGGAVSIRKHCGDLYITPLEDLLVASTELRSDRRPTMEAFAERLREWIRISDSFPEHNPLQWAEVQRRLFPLNVPARAVWENLDEIIAVLNILGETSNLNHLFYPGSGGLDLERAVASRREPGCIELIANGMPTIVRPSRLMFESFGADAEWNYFRLETAELEPSGVYDEVGEL